MPQSAAKSPPSDLYETDFFAWTQQQARLLRERRWGELDLENLTDEVASVGSSEKREIRSRLKVLLAHLLKWKYQAGRRGASWRRTVRAQRRMIEEVLADSPSLRGYARAAVDGAYAAAVISAAEETGITADVFPEQCPFTAEQVFDPAFFPEDPAAE